MLQLALALALAAAAALCGSAFLIVPTSVGIWRGIVDPPGLARIAASLLAAFGSAWLLRHAPRELKTPLLAVGLSAAPLVPIATARATLLLAFQGRILLLVVGSVAAVVLVRSIRLRRLGPPSVPTWVLVALAFAAYAAFGTRVPGAARAQGDEPHYLLMAHSLVHDGDLDLANQYAERQYLPFYGGELVPHVSAATRPGTAYSKHAPGLPALVAPAYALFGYRGVLLFLSFVTALGAALVREVVRDALHDEWLALATWAVVAFTPPLPIYAVAIYPETVAAAVVALLLWLRRDTLGPVSAAVAGALAGGLVWLHPKMLPLGAAALVLLLPRARSRTSRVMALVLFAAAAGSFLLYMRAIFGRPTLSAGFGDPKLSLLALPWGTLAQLFDRQRGLFSIGPVWMLAVFGVAGRLRARPRDSLLLLLVVVTPIAVGGAYADWGGGSCPPSRFPLPALAPLAVFLAQALARRRDLGAALAGIGLGILLVATAAPRVLRTLAYGDSNLLHDLAPIDLNGMLPSYAGAASVVPVLLSTTLVAALALGWRYGARGIVMGSLACLTLANAFRDRPLVDAESVTRQVIATWDRGNLVGPTGRLDVATLAVPFELAGGPQLLRAGAVRRSRRIDLPPGVYRLSFVSRSSGASAADARVSVAAGPIPLAETLLLAGSSAETPLFLPTGARGLGFAVFAEQGELVFERAIVRPEAIVPRSRRNDLTTQRRLQPDEYRLERGNVRVTLLEGFAAEGEGFRVCGAAGRLVLDGPLTTAVTFRIRREPAGRAGTLAWGRRLLALGPGPDLLLQLSLLDGEPLGRQASLPVRIEAPRALVSFEGGGGR